MLRDNLPNPTPPARRFSKFSLTGYIVAKLFFCGCAYFAPYSLNLKNFVIVIIRIYGSPT